MSSEAPTSRWHWRRWLSLQRRAWGKGTPSSRIHPQRRCWDSGLSFCFLVKRRAISLSHSLPPWCVTSLQAESHEGVRQTGSLLFLTGNSVCEWQEAVLNHSPLLPSWRCVPSSSAGLPSHPTISTFLRAESTSMKLNHLPDSSHIPFGAWRSRSNQMYSD